MTRSRKIALAAFIILNASAIIIPAAAASFFGWRWRWITNPCPWLLPFPIILPDPS